MSGLPPALAAQLQSVIDQWAANQSQFADWLAGTVGGGPNGDGRYPLTNAQGVEVSVACPASIMDMVEGPAAQAEVANLAAQASATAAATSASNTDAAKVLAEAAKTAAVAARNLAQTAQSNAANHEANARYWAELAATQGGEITVMANTVIELSEQVSTDAANAHSNAVAAANSAALAATFNPALFDLKTDPLASSRLTGMIDPARIPIMLSQYPVVSTGGLANLTTQQQDGIGPGTIVATTDGRRWVYSGNGSKTAEASFIEQGDITPIWDVIAGKPLEFNPSPHSHAWNEITGKPSTFTATAHTHSMSEISGLNTALDGKLNVGDAISNAQLPATMTGKTFTSATMLSGGSLLTIFDSETNNRLIAGATTGSNGGAYLEGTYSSGGTANLTLRAAGVANFRATMTGPVLAPNGDWVTSNGDINVIKNNPWLVLTSSNGGAEGVEQAAGISIGESGYKGSASLHLTYTGDGYGHIGMGAVNGSTSLPAYEAMRFYYTDNRVRFMTTPQVWGVGDIWHVGNDGAGSGLDADLLDGMQPSEGAGANTIMARNASGRVAAQGIDFNVSINDLINDAPWYGVGRSSLTYGSGGEYVMQLSGYYGTRVRSQSVILDVTRNRAILETPAGKDFRVDAHLNATRGIIDYSRDDNGGTPTRILIPQGGAYVTGSSTATGAIKIRLPAGVANANNMLTFTVRVYEYATGYAKTLHLAGYLYNNGWVNVSARCDADAAGMNEMVRFGWDGTSQCVWIGETSRVWSYPQVHVMDVTCGYSGFTNAFASDWQISFATAFDTISTSRTPAIAWTQNNDGSGSGLDADFLDGYHAASFSRASVWNSDKSLQNGITTCLDWRNYGQNHVIFDASSSTSPAHGSINRTNSDYAWAAGYPTLMGWNGGQTYGVRVDSSRLADNAGALGGFPVHHDGVADTVARRDSSGNLTAASYYTPDWYRVTGIGGLYWQSYARGIRVADASQSYGTFATYGAGLNGYSGIAISESNNNILMTNGTTWGHYNPQWGWMMSSDHNGNVTFGGNVTAYSDLRLKENVREIDRVTERRDNLAKAAIRYEREGRTRIGYGAQIVRQTNPEFVHEADDARKLADDLGTLSVDYGETAAILAVASKNTDDEVAALKAQVAALTAAVAALQRNQ